MSPYETSHYVWTKKLDEMRARAEAAEAAVEEWTEVKHINGELLVERDAAVKRAEAAEKHAATVTVASLMMRNERDAALARVKELEGENALHSATHVECPKVFDKFRARIAELEGALREIGQYQEWYESVGEGPNDGPFALAQAVLEGK